MNRDMSCGRAVISLTWVAFAVAVAAGGTQDVPGSSGEYLGHHWHIDPNHMMWWDGSPYIPFGGFGVRPDDEFKLDTHNLWIDFDPFIENPQYTREQHKRDIAQKLAAMTEAGRTCIVQFSMALPHMPDGPRPGIRWVEPEGGIDASRLADPAVEQAIFRVWADYAPAVRSECVRGIVLWNEINVWRWPERFSAEEYAEVLQKYVRQAKRLVGDLPVCFKAAGTWNAGPAIAAAAAADGLGFDIWFSRPEDPHAVREIHHARRMLEQRQKKTTWFFIAEGGRIVGEDGEEFGYPHSWPPFHSKQDAREILQSYARAGAKGFIYNGPRPDRHRTYRDSYLWLGQLRPEITMLMVQTGVPAEPEPPGSAQDAIRAARADPRVQKWLEGSEQVRAEAEFAAQWGVWIVRFFVGDRSVGFASVSPQGAVLEVGYDEDRSEDAEASPLPAPIWPQGGYSEAARGSSPVRGPQTNRLKWSFRLDGWGCSPVIGADGTVYVGTTGGTLYAIARDGSERWSRRWPVAARKRPEGISDAEWDERVALGNSAQGQVFSCAVASDGTVYAAQGIESDEADAERHLFALDTEGREKWRYSVGRDNICTRITLGADGTIYFGTSGRLWKYHAVTPAGRLKWCVDFAPGEKVASAAIGSNGLLYVGGDRLWAFDTADGRLVHKSGERIYSACGSFGPTVGPDGTVYIPSGVHSEAGHYLYAYRADLSLKWRINAGVMEMTPAIAADGTVYIHNWGDVLGVTDGKAEIPPGVHAIRPDGTVKWSREGLMNAPLEALDDNPANAVLGSDSSPIVDPDGTIYFGSDIGKIFAVTAAGEPLWELDFGGEFDTRPAIDSDGTLYICHAGGPGARTGGCYCYAISDEGEMTASDVERRSRRGEIVRLESELEAARRAGDRAEVEEIRELLADLRAGYEEPSEVALTTHSVPDYGARGDGRTNDAAAIQRAIDECSHAGGGRVVLPAGRTYLCGTIRLKANVDLHIEKGATLRGSTNRDHYGRERALIVARGGDNISISGGGTIDGDGLVWMNELEDDILRPEPGRPGLLYIRGCKHVTITDVTIRNSAAWTIRLLGCEDVLLEGIRILDDLRIPNCDGIDRTGSLKSE